MQQNQKIIDSIKKLAEIELDNGVQPYELVKSISSEGYQSIETKKVDDGIVCNVTFEDEELFSSKKIVCCYRYIYDNNMRLLEIYDTGNKRDKLIWSREIALEKAIEEVMLNMNILSDIEREKFINDLPISLKEITQEKFKQIS